MIDYTKGNTLKICDQRLKFIQNSGHSLVLGGPGSGKTTISLIKAEAEIAKGSIADCQRILFLSFARATISRVAEKSREQLEKRFRSSIEINTYHGFCWSLLRSHGYLIGLLRNSKVISPAALASQLADIRASTLPNELKDSQIKSIIEELAFNEGVVSFDLFAQLTSRLLNENPRLTKIICNRFPIIILDEFQDTNDDEWSLIKAVGKESRLISLADPEQRIFEFRGANPARINQFLTEYSPELFDFGTDNNRSPGTDITQFGNDLLSGANKTKKYTNVSVKHWWPQKSTTYHLRLEILSAIVRLKGKREKWTLAVLVPTKKMMLRVSDLLRHDEHGLPKIYHSVSIDQEGPTLAARVVMYLLEPDIDQSSKVIGLTNLLILFFRGKGGTTPTKTDLDHSTKLKAALEVFQLNVTLPPKGILKNLKDCLDNVKALKFTGNPELDWFNVLELLGKSKCPRLRVVKDQASYVRILSRGMQLREALSESWRTNGSYHGAVSIIDSSFLKEHFTASVAETHGVVIMNMHKAKGKEFDEVILFEEQYHPYYRLQSDIDKARINLRVSVTRARQKTTIFTPKFSPSILL